jgi:hypothetical protein
MAELIAYLTFFHWNFDIIYLSPAVIYPVIYIASKCKLSFYCFGQKEVYFYLFWVLIVSACYQVAIGQFVSKELVTFLMQIICYFFSWNISYSAIKRNSSNLKLIDRRIEKYLYLILIVILVSLISTIVQGYGYVHGQNLFGNIVLIAPEWPMFSASTMAAVIVFIEKRYLITTLFIIILLAGQARATILIYSLYFIKNINPILILLLMISTFLMMIGALDLTYLYGRFAEILIQLDIRDLHQYIALLSDNEIYNDRLYKEDNIDLIFPNCERLGDMGRVGNSVAALMYSSSRLIFGSGFTLSSTYLLCDELGFYHPSGPAWNPIINSFIQGGIPGFILLVMCIYKGYDRNLIKHKPYLLVILLLIALNIMKGLNSYQFWSLVGIINAYKFAYDKRIID